MAMSKSQRMLVYQDRWVQWKESGNEPANRSEALRILRDELANLSISLDTSAIKKELARYSEDTGEYLPSALSFVVWDLVENDGKALDYGLDNNYFRGLLEQAGKLLTSYTRVRLKIGEQTYTVPSSVEVRGQGRQLISQISAAQLQQIADAWIESASTQMIRWKALGANKTTVKRYLNKLQDTVLEAYEEEEEN
jgi:hypothetical protein